MAFQSTLEIMIHLNHLRNIDVTKQGSYRLRFSLFFVDHKTKKVTPRLISLSPHFESVSFLHVHPKKNETFWFL